MASNSTSSPATPKQITLRIFVDKEENKVLYAEAGKDFVDILLSFLTLPLGTITRLVSKDSNMKPLRLGCISSLYQSVANLDPKYFNSETCKQMLLRPRSSMERYNQRLKLNIDDTDPTKFYACEMQSCRTQSNLMVSTFNGKKCSCGKNLTHVLKERISTDDCREGYVREGPYVVYDDLNVMAVNVTATSCMLKILRTSEKVGDFAMNIDPKEVMDLLKCSLVSDTVLTDSLLRRKQIIENSKAFVKISDSIHGIREDKRMKLSVMISKSKSKVLFAIVDEDFMDQLLSFLTIPLGAVEKILQGKSGLGCIDKLYHSLPTFDSVEFISGKNMLEDLKLAPQYNVNKQILPICAVMYPSSLYLFYSNFGDPASSTCYLTQYYNPYSPARSLAVNLWDPQSPSRRESSYGYVKRPMMFMVADDLSAKPFTSSLVLSCLNESKVSENDLEEKTIFVGVQEVANILKASLVSESALTMGLAQFLTNTTPNIKEEKQRM